MINNDFIHLLLKCSSLFGERLTYYDLLWKGNNGVLRWAFLPVSTFLEYFFHRIGHTNCSFRCWCVERWKCKVSAEAASFTLSSFLPDVLERDRVVDNHCYEKIENIMDRSNNNWTRPHPLQRLIFIVLEYLEHFCNQFGITIKNRISKSASR